MKRLLATIALSLCSAQLWADGYVIKVDVGVPGVSEVKLSIGDKRTKAEVINNRVEFSGEVDGPVEAQISIGSRYHTLILENAAYSVRWEGYETLSTGSNLHNLVYGYLHDEKYIESRKASYQVALKSADIDQMDREAVESWGAKRQVARAVASRTKNDYWHNILQGDYSALEKFWVLKYNYDWDRYDFQKKLEMAQELHKQLPDTPQIVAYIESIERGIANEKLRASLAPGQPYKPVVANTVDGKPVELGTVLEENELVLLEFWASWCGPCRAAFPHLKRVYSEYHGKGFEIVAISLDEDYDDWVQALEEEGAPWVNLTDDGGWDAQSARDYGVKGLPASFLMTSDGKMLGSNFRGWKLDDALKEYFDQ